MIVTRRRSKRGVIDTTYSILYNLRDKPKSFSRLMGDCELNYKTAKELTIFLNEKGLIRKNEVCRFELTEFGKKILSIYDVIIQIFLNSGYEIY